MISITAPTAPVVPQLAWYLATAGGRSAGSPLTFRALMLRARPMAPLLDLVRRTGDKIIGQ